jgi:Gly-Xaa carboxypeptidase
VLRIFTASRSEAQIRSGGFLNAQRHVLTSTIIHFRPRIMNTTRQSKMEEKATLPNIRSAGSEPSPKPSFKRRLGQFLLWFICTIFLWKSILDYSQPMKNDAIGRYPANSKAKCPQMDALFPGQTTKELTQMDEYLQTEKFKNESIARLAGAVRIPTMSFDDMGKIGEDKRWDIFYQFAQYLKDTFPLAHEKLDLEIVNVHGLVYTWKGSDESLKPTLLMAHQDVVPVPESTIPAWTHPPFDGVYDGKFIWGRGASDCKNSLIAILETIELLVTADFEPKRSIVLSFGFDEEISGREGAGHLAPFLLEKYGKDAFAIIIDEGAGVNTLWGTHFATPGVAEKGYVDVEIVSISVQ